MSSFWNSKTAMIAAGALAAAGVVWFLSNRALAGVKKAGQGVNPANPDNIINQAVNAVGDTLTGGEKGSFSLGSWVYDLTHKEYDPNAESGDAREKLDFIDYADLRGRRGAVTTPDRDSIR